MKFMILGIIYQFSIDQLLYSLLFWLALFFALCYLVPKILESILNYKIHYQQFKHINEKEKKDLIEAKEAYGKMNTETSEKLKQEFDISIKQKQEEVLKYLINETTDEQLKKTYLHTLAKCYEIKIDPISNDNITAEKSQTQQN